MQETNRENTLLQVTGDAEVLKKAQPNVRSLLQPTNTKQHAMRLGQAFVAIQQTVDGIDYAGYQL